MSAVEWQEVRVPLHFRLGEITLFTRQLNCLVRNPVFPTAGEVCAPSAPPGAPHARTDGYFIRSLPVPGSLARVSREGDWIRYVPNQYERFYVDLGMSADDYLGQFSARSRSGLRRKVRKFARESGGENRWRTYRSEAEMQEFHRLAREVSAKTYQERMLDAGLPDSVAFKQRMCELARHGQVRGYLLFDGDKPVAYLYTPARDGVLLYQYLGYDLDYAKRSPGTVLQWLALEQLFAEGTFRVFDFTAGEGAHKAYFSTNSQYCADVFYLPRSPGNRFTVAVHRLLDAFSDAGVAMLDRLGVKARVKRFFRKHSA